jgi:hypothetical protein
MASSLCLLLPQKATRKLYHGCHPKSKGSLYGKKSWHFTTKPLNQGASTVRNAIYRSVLAQVEAFAQYCVYSLMINAFGPN